MHIVISGASGFIGTELSRTLREAGNTVTALVRRAPASPAEIQWDPLRRQLDPQALASADAIINLSGAGIGDRPWTRKRKAELVSSRIGSTRTLTGAMSRMDVPPPVFISQSASGYYGDAGAAVVREEHPKGDGFLAGLCEEWEAAAHEAPPGVRVLTPRTGVVLSPTGGALARLLPLLRVGLGGPLGNGRQYWPWITVPDLTSAFAFLLHADAEGAVNVCGPEPADVNTLVHHLGQALHRPTAARVPGFVLKLVMDGLADELLLASQRMEPAVLAGLGFTWQHPTMDSAAGWVAAGIRGR
ncbi:TIGR01777 family oxidoreductase [Pseudarthrobacter sp. J75]|uniref:TIGR01777 family oxidoreductase n=1 Tax=unclassified Pseudarthrobacter TaxID=2647000 RepID=UPI002E80970F|nr:MULTISPECIES: TIGR01777 family oxidoreductase [unclassified Pseudarthrobacter]MEE2522732.1 TIGR01777 family oxidoreductase [Pseudarthrobacter sp. J47]MEE2529593.1 TIGR01777 family oxidoreductase [Pseudarthrobacter sp. J75]